MSATNDPIADLLTRIRNAIKAQHRFVDLRFSRINAAIVKILKDQGFIDYFLIKEDEKQGAIRVFLKYAEGRQPIINGIKRVSRPGLRRYVGYSSIPLICGGLGITIVSTSKGLMAGHEAHKLKVGGELLCQVW